MAALWQRDPRVLWRRSGSRTVLLCPSSAEALLVDGVGSITWALLTEPIGESDLFTTLADGFAVDLATVEAATTSFLEELHAAGAVQRV